MLEYIGLLDYKVEYYYMVENEISTIDKVVISWCKGCVCYWVQ